MGTLKWNGVTVLAHCIVASLSWATNPGRSLSGHVAAIVAAPYFYVAAVAAGYFRISNPCFPCGSYGSYTKNRVQLQRQLRGCYGRYTSHEKQRPAVATASDAAVSSWFVPATCHLVCLNSDWVLISPMGPGRQQPRVIRVTDHGVQLYTRGSPFALWVQLLTGCPSFFGKNRAASTEIRKQKRVPNGLELTRNCASYRIHFNKKYFAFWAFAMLDFY